MTTCAGAQMGKKWLQPHATVLARFGMHHPAQRSSHCNTLLWTVCRGAQMGNNWLQPQTTILARFGMASSGTEKLTLPHTDSVAACVVEPRWAKSGYSLTRQYLQDLGCIIRHREAHTATHTWGAACVMEPRWAKSVYSLMGQYLQDLGCIIRHKESHTATN